MKRSRTLNQEQEEKQLRISYSQLNRWLTCPHYHYLVASKKFVEPPNIYTASGRSLHFLSETLLLDYQEGVNNTPEHYLDIFTEEFKKELEGVADPVDDSEKRLYLKIAYDISKNYIQFIKESLGGDFEVIKVEKEISEIFYVSDIKVHFVGYVDFFIKKDNKYYIFDLKTIKRKWNSYKRKDSKFLNQLYAYKFFICKEYKIDIEDISCNYLFVDSLMDYERMEVKCSDEQISELFEDVKKMVVNFYVKNNYVKNPVECKFCSCKKYYNSQKGKQNDE